MFVFEESLSQIRDLVENDKKMRVTISRIDRELFKSCYEFLSVLKMEQNAML